MAIAPQSRRDIQDTAPAGKIVSVYFLVFSAPTSALLGPTIRAQL